MASKRIQKTVLFLGAVLTFATPIGVLAQDEGEGGGDSGGGESGSGSVSTTCGGTLNSNQGRIEYKHLQPYQPKELCVWAITSAGSASITFTLEANGLIQTTQDYLAVGYFNNSDYKTAASYKEQILRHNSAKNTLTVPGPTAFLHFISDATIHGLGFIVSFTSEAAEFPPPHHFINFHYSTDFGQFRYPPEGAEPKPSERLAFFVRPSVPVTLALKWLHGECGGSKDVLTVYERQNSFDRSTLRLKKQFCNSPMELIPIFPINVGTEMVITFQTNETRSAEAPLSFEFVWVPNTVK